MKKLRNAQEPRAVPYIYAGWKNQATSYYIDTRNDRALERGHEKTTIERVAVDNRVVTADSMPVVQAANDNGSRSGQPVPGPVQGGDTPETLKAVPDAGYNTESYMLTDARWSKLVDEYGPFDHEACSDVEGKNARLDSRKHPQDSFLNWKPDLLAQKIYLNPPYSKSQIFLDYARKLWRNNQDICITAVVPDWKEINTVCWTLMETIPTGCDLFMYPDGGTPGPTKWPVKVLRLHPVAHTPRTAPKEVHSTTDLGNDIIMLRLEEWREDPYYTYGTAHIKSDNGTHWIHVVGLI